MDENQEVGFCFFQSVGDLFYTLRPCGNAIVNWKYQCSAVGWFPPQSPDWLFAEHTAAREF
jgi:hypothetical protein